MSNRDPQGDRVPEQRKSAYPLIWILVLIALFAFGWYLYNQRGVVAPPVQSQIRPVVGSTQDAAAERERSATDRGGDGHAGTPATP